MSSAFPSKYPKGYTAIITPHMQVPITVMDPEGKMVTGQVTRELAIEKTWRVHLDRLGYGGVAMLIHNLQTQVDEAMEASPTTQNEEVQALRKEIEELQKILDAKSTPDDGKSDGDSDGNDEGKVAYWKKRAEESEAAHKKLSEKADKMRGHLAKAMEFKSKLSDLNSSMYSVLGSKWEMDKLLEPEPRKAVDPAWDFDGPIPDKLPDGFELKDHGKGKPLRYTLKDPDGNESLHCDKKNLLATVWGGIRKANKAKADKGEIPPDYEPEKPPELPPGFKEEFDGKGALPYKLTTPDKKIRYFATPQKLNEAAWKIHNQTPTKPTSTSSTSTAKASPAPESPYKKTSYPDGYTPAFNHGKEYEWVLWLPGHGSPRQKLGFRSKRARMIAAWIHQNAKLGEKMSSIRGMEEFPENFEGMTPPGFSLSHDGVRPNKYVLVHPDRRRTYHETFMGRRWAGWEYHRRIISDNGKMFARELQAPDIKKGDDKAEGSFPAGYDYTYLGMSVEKPHNVKMSGGDHIAFSTRDEALQAAWAHKTADDQVNAAPPEYVIGVAPAATNGHYATAPSGENLYRGKSKQEAVNACWKHYSENGGDAVDDGPKSSAELPVSVPEADATKWKEILPAGYDYSFHDGKMRAHVIRCGSWSCEKVSKIAAHVAAWRHFTVAARTEDKIPPISDEHPLDTEKEASETPEGYEYAHNPANRYPHTIIHDGKTWGFAKKEHAINWSVRQDQKAKTKDAAAALADFAEQAASALDYPTLTLDDLKPDPETGYTVDEEKSLPPGVGYRLDDTSTPHVVFEDGWSCHTRVREDVFAMAWGRFYARNPELAAQRNAAVDRRFYLPAPYRLKVKSGSAPFSVHLLEEWSNRYFTKPGAIKAAWAHYDEENPPAPSPHGETAADDGEVLVH